MGPRDTIKKKNREERVRNSRSFCNKTVSVGKASEKEREKAHESGGQKDREQEHQAHQITF